MSKYGTLSKMATKCQICDKRDTCDKKRMEMCAYLIPQSVSFPNGVSVLNPNTSNEIRIEPQGYESPMDIANELMKASKYLMGGM